MKVAQLRQAILQAAVHGKLVPQNPQDEPASVLLERIQTEKVQLIKEGKIKKEKSLPPIAEDEIPYDLPDSWEWCRLGDICTKITDGSHNPPPNTGRGIPVISAKNIRNGEISFSNVDRFTDEKGFAKENPRTNISFGDIILGIIGGSIGNVAIYRHDQRVIAQRSIAIMNSLIDNDFLNFFLRSPQLQTFLGLNTSGTAQGGVYLGQLKSIMFPLPPLAEQWRIVAKLNELMAFCDELEAAEKELDALELNFAGYLPKSILQAAVQGKLVPQNLHDEPVSELLKRIQTEKARLTKDGKIKKEKSLPPIAEDEIPYDLPNGWEWCRLGDICTKIGSGSTPRGGKDAYTRTGIPFLRSQNVRDEGLDMGNVAFIPTAVHAKMSGTYVFPKDILLNITGGSLGRCALVPDDFQQANVSQHVTIIRLCDPSLRRFIHFMLLSPYCQEMIWSRQIGMAREGLSKRTLEMFEIPLPPIAEQQRIVAKIDELMTLCEQIKNIDTSTLPLLGDVQQLRASKPVLTFEEPEEQYAMAARGNVSVTETKEHQQAMKDLFGDGEDG